MTITLHFETGRREFTNIAAFYPHPIEDNTYILVKESGNEITQKFVQGFYVQDAI